MDRNKLAELLRQKDSQGVNELLKSYGALMRYIIAPILPNEQDCEECLSEVTAGIWEKIDTFDSERGSFNSWITAVTRNTALNYRRKLAQNGNPEELKENIPSFDPTPEDEVIRKEYLEEVSRALTLLSNKDRMLLYRKYYYFQSIAQIASETGMTERAVAGRLYRLKKKLRKMLGGE